MTKLTENSVLSRPDKLEIISRINNMRIEVNMLKKYVDERTFFLEMLKNYEGTVLSWIKQINPDISLQKIKAEQIGRYYIMGLLGILVLNSLIFFASFVYNRMFTRNTQEIMKRK
jgi:hypothetical protein